MCQFGVHQVSGQLFASGEEIRNCWMDSSKSNSVHLLNPGLVAQLKQLSRLPQKSMVQTTSGSGVSVQVLSGSRHTPMESAVLNYAYKVINQAKKTDVVIRHLNQIHFPI